MKETAQFKEGIKNLSKKTPSPVLTPEQRKDLLEKTVKMVVGYEGAGTVEFIYENGNFYFRNEH